VTGYDRSHRMRHNRTVRESKYLNDTLIAARIAAENLLIPVVDPSPLTPRDSVQQAGSDWAVLKELAERNGFLVYVRGDKLFFRFPRPDLSRVVLEWGRTLTAFAPRLSATGVPAIQVLRDYNAKLAQSIVAVLPAVAAGDLDDLAERLGQEAMGALAELGKSLGTYRPLPTPLDGALVAKAVLARLFEGLYEGSGACIGNPELRAGDLVEVTGVGKRFGGRYRLRTVRHSIDDRGYVTEFEVAQTSTGTLAELLRTKLIDAPPPNRRAPEYGVVVGQVVNNVDPEGLGRLLLTFPHLSDDNVSGWARVAAPSDGLYFLPKLGDDVLVQFEHGDLDRPVIIGAAWHARNRPPAQNADGLNRVRTVTTPAGHTIEFDDTPGAGKVTIKDAGGSRVELAAGGKLTVSAATKLTLTAPAIEIAADGNIEINAANVKVAVDGKMDVS
jgi:phage protein D/phage baseplate assembly protein gpV